MVSVLAIEIVAVRKPTVGGSKVTTKVVVPVVGAIGELGWVVIVKSPAFAPVIATFGVPDKFKGAIAVFSIVKVRAIVPEVKAIEPKSVWLVVVGLLSLCRIVLPFPLMLISETHPLLTLSPVIDQPLPPLVVGKIRLVLSAVAAQYCNPDAPKDLPVTLPD
ncbi:hypothetical protein FLACHUCJ7_00017 [Flavobacterium chungangense]|uniref:Uncharacterized protein n=1 Tax=Flavobacterium chungangense TaxID=554283 RepID=A0A6V6YLN8_9FLAO|nr:hypothetical protein FLACHUCJ7_00017 [Flavobacterium chungangense]